MPLSLSKNKFFDRLTELKGAVKTSKPNPSAYMGTVGFGLRSKSKCLAAQGVFRGYPGNDQEIATSGIRPPRNDKVNVLIPHFDGWRLF